MKPNIRFLLMASLLLATAVFAQQKGSFTDPRDKKTYKTVKIGEQVWMAQNLDYNGEDGFLGLCYGDVPKDKIRKPENCKKYGRLYDWGEALKACPSGWHLSSYHEWQALVDFVGGEEIAGKKLKAKSGWTAYDFSGTSHKAPKCKWTEQTKEEIDNRGRVITPAGVVEYDKCITDEYGFSALPGGGSYDYFREIDSIGIFWSSNDHDSDLAYLWTMYYGSEEIRNGHFDKSYLFSVRCIQDVAAEATNKTDKINSAAARSQQQIYNTQEAIRKWKDMAERRGCYKTTASKKQDPNCKMILRTLSQEEERLKSLTKKEQP